MRFFFLLLICFPASAQVGIPIKFTSEEANKLIKETDSVKYYEATGAPEYVVSIDEEAGMYKLLGKNHKVVAEGAFITEDDKLVQDGKWTERYDNGKLKLTGCYRRGRPVGTWKEFYEEGRVKTIYNFAIIIDGANLSSCMSGSYEEFYPDGKIKVSGFYAAVRELASDTVRVEDPVTGNKVYTVNPVARYKAEKTGHWENYDENGEAEKKDE